MHGLDPQAARVVEMLSAGASPGPVSLETVRAWAPLPRELTGTPPAMRSVTDRAIPVGDVVRTVRIYVPEVPEGTRSGIAVFFHGGGWVIGGLELQDPLCRAIAASAGSVIVSVDYRLAPEHPYPAAVHDAWGAVCWVAEHGGLFDADVSRFAVIGDSSGANLAAVVARIARDAGGPTLAHQVLVCPVTDCDLDSPSMRAYAEGHFLTADRMRWYWTSYAPDPDDATHPCASPARAKDLSGLPEALIVTAECDPLRDQGIYYGRRLVEAGVPVSAVCVRGMMHSFLGMQGAIDAARNTLNWMGNHLTATIGPRPRPSMESDA